RCALRDSMMAANLLAIAERGPTLVHAHNGHLQRDRSSMRMGGQPLRWWGAGAIVSAHLGQGYAFLATALGTIRHHDMDAPPPDTVEGLLYALPQDRFVVDTGRLAAIRGDRRAEERAPGPPGPAHTGTFRPLPGTNRKAIYRVRFQDPGSVDPSPEPRTDRRSTSETSVTRTLSAAASCCFRTATPSVSMTMQYGHAAVTSSAPVRSASSVRVSLMRVPIRSSIHMRAPPAPQQNEVVRLRGISVSRTPGTLPRISLGGSNTRLCRPR